MSNSARINLAIPIELSIQIEMECEKRGINRTQFIKETLFEKMQKKEPHGELKELITIKQEVDEIKKILLLLLELNHKK